MSILRGKIAVSFHGIAKHLQAFFRFSTVAEFSQLPNPPLRRPPVKATLVESLSECPGADFESEGSGLKPTLWHRHVVQVDLGFLAW